MFVPFSRKPGPEGHCLKTRLEIDASVRADARPAFAMQRAFAISKGGQVNLINRNQRFCDEQMRSPQVELRDQRHSQSAPCSAILEIAPIGGDEQLRAEKSCALPAESPRYIHVGRLDSVEIHPVRQQ